jgi:hypothetical protein
VSSAAWQEIRVGMTNRRGWLKGKGLLPRDRILCGLLTKWIAGLAG